MTATLRLTREGVGIELRRAAIDIHLDGRNAGSIESHASVELPLEAGHHTLQTRSGRYSSRTLEFEARDGEVLNFRTHGAMVWPRALASVFVPSLGVSLKRE